MDWSSRLFFFHPLEQVQFTNWINFDYGISLDLAQFCTNYWNVILVKNIILDWLVPFVSFSNAVIRQNIIISWSKINGTQFIMNYMFALATITFNFNIISGKKNLLSENSYRPIVSCNVTTSTCTASQWTIVMLYCWYQK